MPGSELSDKRTASVARIPSENVQAVRDLLSPWNEVASKDRVGIYLREIEGDHYLFRYTEGGENGSSAAAEAGLVRLVEPLPIAETSGRVFEPMERVFYEPGAADKEPRAGVVRIAMITGLRHEKEKDYRLLHDNPWPDVIAAIRRANLRHFSIFLEEIRGKLYLFGWLEYVGSDQQADTAANKKDPASIRWWRETDACQIAPPDADGGMWGGMEELVFIGG